METRRVLGWSLYQLLRPVARVCLRHGLTVGDLVEVIKQVFVDVAREEHGLRGRPTNKSRVAAMTGLTRQDVARLADAARPAVNGVGSRHPLQRLVSHWTQQAPFCSARGNPRTLSTEDGASGFQALVRAEGVGIPHQTLLREMERMGLVEVADGGVRLLERGFVPGGVNEADRIPFLGENGAALLDTIDHNLRCPGAAARFERRVLFPGLTPAGLKALSDIAQVKGQQLLEEIDERLAAHALPADGIRRLTGLGIYTFDFTQPVEGTSQ